MRKDKEGDYSINEDDAVGIAEAGAHTRHPNRHEDKDRQKSTPDPRRKSIIRSQENSIDDKPNRDNHVREEGHRNFFVLILSKKKAKFFMGDMSGLKHIEISELPSGINDVVHLEEKDDKNLFRAGGSGGNAGSSNFHGMGAGVPDEKENIAMYLKEVDKTLWTSGLNKANSPLVLGGVEYIVAMYKDISQYKHIADKMLTGSVEKEDPKVIYKKANEIVNPVNKG